MLKSAFHKERVKYSTLALLIFENNTLLKIFNGTHDNFP